MDTLYASQLTTAGLSIADAKALESMGWAEVRRTSSRRMEYRVTLNKVGRHYRDEKSSKAAR